MISSVAPSLQGANKTTSVPQVEASALTREEKIEYLTTTNGEAVDYENMTDEELNGIIESLVPEMTEKEQLAVSKLLSFVFNSYEEFQQKKIEKKEITKMLREEIKTRESLYVSETISETISERANPENNQQNCYTLYQEENTTGDEVIPTYSEP